MKRPIDLVMFDLDGTLADTGQDLADAVNHTRAHFDLEPLPEPPGPHATVARAPTASATSDEKRRMSPL